METVKLTKKNLYDAIINLINLGEATVEIDDNTVEVSYDAIVEFCEKEKAALANKAAKAKENAAKKKTEDALLNLVEAALTSEPQTIAEIVEKLVEADPDVTAAKVTSRLKTLVDNKVVVKSDVSVPTSEGKKRTIKGYALVDAE